MRPTPMARAVKCFEGLHVLQAWLPFSVVTAHNIGRPANILQVILTLEGQICLVPTCTARSMPANICKDCSTKKKGCKHHTEVRHSTL